MTISGAWGAAHRGARVPAASPAAAVLVVHDDQSKRLAIKAVLAPLHLHVIEADSGLSALRSVMKRDFAVILLDVRLPDIDGFETAALIRRRKESEMTPIIFITAFTSDEIASKAKYVPGAVDYMTAPASPEELRAKVSVFVNLFTHAANLAARTREVQGSADRLEVLTNAVPVGIFRTDANNRYVYTNARWSEISGISCEDAYGRDWATVFAATGPTGTLVDEFEISGQSAVEKRFRLWSSDSISRVVLVTSEPIKDERGEATGWVGTLTDVTAEAEAGRERARFRALIQNSRDAIAITDPNGSCSYASTAIEELSGFSADEFQSLSPFGYIHPEDAETFAAAVQEILPIPNATKILEVRARTKDRGWIWIEMRVANRLDNPSIQGIGLNFHDISERKAAETERLELVEDLRRSDQLFRGAFDASQLGIALTSPDGVTYVDVNQSLCDMLGYTKAELMELNWQQITHVEDLERNLKEFARLQDGHEDAARLEKRYVGKAGNTIWIEIHDAVLRWPDGQTMCFVTHVNDVTERHDAALAREGLETQLNQSQKMEAVGQLAGGVAHDFNNILAVILNYAQFASDGLEADDPRLADIKEISRAGEKAAKLVAQLLAFSRKEVMQQEVIDLNEVVAGVFSILGRALGEDIALDFRRLEDLPRVFADPGRLEQVLLNIAINARDAMPNGGVLQIETKMESVGDGDLPSLPKGDYSVISLCDSGAGMDEATMERIFEPFFTTKARGEGTGMGLSSAYGIIEQAGGSLRVGSQLGVGTTFSIYLPCSDRPYLQITGGALPGSDVANETILLVEDEDAVREIVARVLRAKGYQVVPCSSGADALEYFRMNATTVDLLLTDVVMPKMSGKELSDKATAIQGGLKTLFMSGYTDALIAQRGVLTSDEKLLPKPFNPDELLISVRSTLDQSAA